MKLKLVYGFTLAEILITLGVVGVVAVIALPSIISNYQKKITAARLLHAYSVISQAIEQAEAKNGEIATWEFDNQFSERYLMPNIKDIQKYFLARNGALGITYKELSGRPENSLYIMSGADGATKIYTLANGTQIFIKDSYHVQIPVRNLIIDINGFAKPNQFGKDVFLFKIDKEHKLYPLGRYNSTECKYPSEPNNDRNILKNSTCYNYACNKKSRGTWCAALIMTDGWKIAPDYPW